MSKEKKKKVEKPEAPEPEMGPRNQFILKPPQPENTAMQVALRGHINHGCLISTAYQRWRGFSLGCVNIRSMIFLHSSRVSRHNHMQVLSAYFISLPRTHHTCPHLRAFAHAYPSDPNALPPDLPISDISSCWLRADTHLDQQPLTSLLLHSVYFLIVFIILWAYPVSWFTH